MLFRLINKRQLVRVDKEAVAADATDIIAQFDLNGEFTAEDTRAFWRRSDTGLSYDSLLDADGNTLVPWEVLSTSENPQQWPFGYSHSVFVGLADNDRSTAAEVEFSVLLSGYKDETENTTQPTPSVVEQLIKVTDEYKAETDKTVTEYKAQTDEQMAELDSRMTTAEKKVATHQAAVDHRFDTDTAPPIIEAAAGDVIAVDDAADRGIPGLRVFGKSEQQTTTGAQLLNLPDVESNTYNGITWSCKNGVITAKGTTTASNSSSGAAGIRYSLLGAIGTFTVSGNVSNQVICFVEVTRNGSTEWFNNSSFTLDGTETAAFAFCQVNGTDKTVDATVYPMLNSGDTAQPWEPYTGGQPAPNPEYPMEIESLGKMGNLFDRSLCVDGYSLKADGTTSTNENYQVSDYIPVTAGVYTISEINNLDGGNSTVRCVCFDANKNFLATIYQDNRTVAGKFARLFTVPSGGAFIRFSNRITDTEVMLNEGSAAMPYRPYTGELEVCEYVAGKNLFVQTGSGYIYNDDGTFSATASASGPVSGISSNYTGKLPAGTYTISYLQGYNTFYYMTASGDYSTPIYIGGTRTFQYDGKSFLAFTSTNVPAGTTQTYKVQLEPGDKATAFEPYKTPQPLPIPVGDGLAGIPVSSGGNYTDENGQQWICDEKDFARGVYVQRMHTVVLDGSWANVDIQKSAGYNTFRFANIVKGYNHRRSSRQLCNRFKWASNTVGSADDNIISAYDDNVFLNFRRMTSVEELNAWLQNNNVVLQYRLATPIETPISESEMAAYRSLRTYKPNTTIYNDAGAWQEVSYVADTKLYIDKKLAAIAANLI